MDKERFFLPQTCFCQHFRHSRHGGSAWVVCPEEQGHCFPACGSHCDLEEGRRAQVLSAAAATQKWTHTTVLLL